MNVDNSSFILAASVAAVLYVGGIVAARSIAPSPQLQLVQSIGLTPEESQRIVDLAKAKFPQHGILRQTDAGFCYVDLPDEYIHELFKEIEHLPGMTKPPYFTPPLNAGAHITVIEYGEIEGRVQEIGQQIFFEIQNCKVVTDPWGRHWAILEVDCPALEALRARYGLSPKVEGHEFHITIGVANHRFNV